MKHIRCRCKTDMEKFVESLKGKEVTFDIYFEPGKEVINMKVLKPTTIKSEFSHSTAELKKSLEEGIESLEKQRKEAFKLIKDIHEHQSILVGQLRAMQLSEELLK